MGVSVESHAFVSLNIGGTQIPFITDAVIVMWIVALVVILAIVLLTRALKPVPSGGQNYAEWLVDFINNLAAPIGKHARVFAPYLCTVILFLIVSNTIAIFNIVPSGSFLAWVFKNPSLEHFEFGIEPPTRNINVTACLTVITMIVVVGAEFRYKGLRGWIRSFYQPTPVSAFVKLLDYVVRPLSLCMRLFGNILGGYITMTLLYGAIPILLPAFASAYFDLFDGALQAYIFVFLTTMYLSESVEVHGEEV